MRTLAAMVGTFFLSSCMTASDVMDRGDGTFGVSSVACPACGGSAKSASIAVTKAEEYCKAIGREPVIYDMDNKSTGAVGVGSSDLVFACVEPVSDEALENCFMSGANGLAELFDERSLAEVVPKIIPMEDDFGFARMSDTAKPTPSESKVILGFGERYDQCHDIYRATLDPKTAAIFRSANNRIMGLMAKLASGTITFGDYARSYNDVYEDMLLSNSQLADSLRAKRRSESEARSRAVQKLSDEIRATTDSTACTSRTVGDQTYTNCR